MFCRFFRMMISHAADADGALGHMTQRHIRRCHNCRRFCESCQTLGDALRAEATDLSRGCELLTERITGSLTDVGI